MPRPDTGLGGSGYDTEMMSWNPKTQTFTFNEEQWRKQRGSRNAADEMNSIANRRNSPTWSPLQNRMARSLGIDGVVDYTLALKKRLVEREEQERGMLAEQAEKTRYERAEAARRQREMKRAKGRTLQNKMSATGSNSQSILSKRIQANNAKEMRKR